MKKITKESVNALVKWDNYKKDNTEVITYSYGVSEMYLHWNLVATLSHKEHKLSVTDAGWKTNTTKERLNWILEYFELWYLKQIKGEWYLCKIIDFNNTTGEYTKNIEYFTWEKTFDI